MHPSRLFRLHFPNPTRSSVIRILSSSAIALVLLAGAGCSPAKLPDAPRYKVSGKVTFDGKPLSVGRIVFDPGKGEVPGSFDVTDGRFEGLAPLGKCTIRISATQKVNLKEKYKMEGPGYDTPQEENMIPAKYNTDSQMVREVTNTPANNEFTFELGKN
jgi:hypothetical protein